MLSVLSLMLLAQADAAPLASPPLDPGALVVALLDAIHARNWPLIASLVVFVLVLAARFFGPAIHPWFASRRAAVALAVGFAAAGAVVTPLLAGTPWSGALFGQAITAALAAMGLAGGAHALKRGGVSSKMERRVKPKSPAPPAPPTAAP